MSAGQSGSGFRGEPDRSRERLEMVERQVAARGVSDPAVLDAMRRVPRELFVDPEFAHAAYTDSPLPIAQGQTISQPFIVALMLEASGVGRASRLLEVGTGSGYAAAVAALIAGEVFTVERHPELAEEAAARFAAMGLRNVHVRCGDGTLGWPETAPFDVILVAAGGPEVPASLREQLAVGGRLVIPVGVEQQRLLRVIRTDPNAFTCDDLGPVSFVPLVGRQGWSEG